jgi:hypothetical protein
MREVGSSSIDFDAGDAARQAMIVTRLFGVER